MQNHFLNGLWHHLISETSGTSKFLEYVHDIPEMQKHSSGIASESDHNSF